jgi:glucokinase
MTNPVRVLAADVGGTKTLLQIAEFEGAGHEARVLAEQRFESTLYPDLAPMAYEFLASNGLHGVDRACFAVAGPVTSEDGRQQARLTNLPWRIDSTELAHALHLSRVKVINDFEAVGYGIDGLDRDSLVVLQEAPAALGAPRVVIGAGTGLGVAMLHRCGDHYEVHATEAGHMDYAPCCQEQEDLLAWLRKRYGRVSYERVVSGMGIEDIYRYLAESAGEEEDELLRAADIPAAVSLAAEKNPLAARALDIFVASYGSVAGNLALATLAQGGVYIAGGIAPKILPRMVEGRFLQAFNEKGRMSRITRGLPVQVITNPKVGLIGAALAARRL